MIKTNTTFPASFLRCKFSFHEKRHSSQVWQWRDLPKPTTILCQRIATNGIASFCIDHRWRQMAFFVFVKMGKAPISRTLRETNLLLCKQSLFLYYIKRIDSMLPCICPVIDHRGRQNEVRTSVTHSSIASCATFLFLPHFDVICDLLLDRCTATWNLFVKYTIWPISQKHVCYFSTVFYLIYQQRVRGFYQGFQTPRNRWKHEAASAECFCCFEVFGTPDKTRSTSFWDGFSN